MRILNKMSRPSRSLFPLFLVIVSACGSDGTAPEDTPEAISVDLYTLQSVDGDPLPFLVPAGGAGHRRGNLRKRFFEWQRHLQR